IATIGFFQATKAFHHRIEGFFPCGFFKLAIAFDEGLFQALATGDKFIGGKLPFDTQQILIGWSLRRLYIDNFAVFDNKVKLTTSAAVRTGGQNFFRLPFAIALMAFGAQSPRRTNRDTVATGFTQRLAPIATATWKHLGIKASIGGTDDIPALPHLTNSSAPPTHDTFFRIVIKKG